VWRAASSPELVAPASVAASSSFSRGAAGIVASAGLEVFNGSAGVSCGGVTGAGSSSESRTKRRFFNVRAAATPLPSLRPLEPLALRR